VSGAAPFSRSNRGYVTVVVEMLGALEQPMSMRPSVGAQF